MKLGIRRLLPERLKPALRLTRLAMEPVPPSAPQIPQAQLEGCQLLTDRIEMLRRLPKGGEVAEIGTYKGDFARAILDIMAPARLHLADITFSLCRADVLADPRVERHEGLSVPFLQSCTDASFDMIYVDADHGYDAVRADVAAAAPKVKPGGLLIFNDFARIIRPGFGVLGVHQAVCEFALASGWPVAYFCLEGEALYDIALRRPE
ncbi:MAG: class I SAM-dependent methyltransferase [Roseomonas sp.]|nr:class I SAM-dependent methyltransferase [Roseomonas sp.]MCA3328373.1 class I SAM-dependent methyltransferase [Roseomonas sp.]MCA3330833.1 class I SAM-dependent methyltransferase [Roseomonas sp.]MCA3334322.1 class I SAM-dependent methyltransferase [Roseomonas sp.]MCA3348289.1 class I SAM-dependent methyltransferase [Roseomonas sp.]